MPQSKEVHKEYMRKLRGSQKGSQIEGSQDKGSQEEMVPASYVQGLNGRMYQSLPERPRFVTLSDGQVLDRLNQPIADKTKIPQMRASNECYNFHPAEGKLTKELKAKLS